MIRLLLVDDQELVCQGLQAMLNLEPDIEVVGTANNGEIAIQQVKALQPNIVLLDIKMPIMDGREATRIICQECPDTKVLVLSTFEEDDYIAHSIEAGAKGYLLKDMPIEDLVESVKLVNRGYSVMKDELRKKTVGNVVSNNNNSTEKQSKLAELTPREIEVFNLIGTGYTNREIAKELYIVEGTVKTHVTNIFNRLGLSNRSQIAIYANSIKQNSQDLHRYVPSRTIS